MMTFSMLLFAMLCFISAQRSGRSRAARRLCHASGAAAMAASVAICAAGWGVERGVAMWLLSLMAAGMLAPVTASTLPRLLAPLQRLRLPASRLERLQAAAK